ncbi:MAG: c-type cytochrome [Kofleriaceae bacterium]|jgi:cytochrome c oxidase cbb3-type subunit 3|nr:c-type cytochrome [Kofleriaceae bacterium]MBP6840081.1 c-type cytochrome [Kofleriaceae bacterium]MBP9207073.1 c-type cytochrome [Kofleriaceae bacterium]
MSNDGKKEARVLDHEYDGIQEFDNPQPAYWTWIFLGSTVWALGYFIYYHLGGPGKSDTEQYAAEWAVYDTQRKATEEREAAAVNEGALAAAASNQATLSVGRDVFARNCISCHTEDGRGLVGPNLTDDFQIHGASRVDLYTTIRKGVVEKGMIAWGPVLQPDELIAVAGFVSTLRHSNVAGGKAAEGAKVEPFVH